MAKTKNIQVDEWLDDEDNLLLLESWARDGYTVQDIAMRVGVHVSTFRGWMADYPEIKKAVNTGRELVDYKVENALLKAALGFKTREVKVVATMKHGKIVEERKEVTDKEFAPNVSAITAWLYNRQPKKWKNMNSKVNMLDELDEDTSIHVTVERATLANMDSDSTTVDRDDAYINTGVSIRRATKEEQEAAKAARATQYEDEAPDEDWEAMLQDDEIEVKTSTTGKRKSSTGKESKSTKVSNNSAKGSVQKDTIQHTDDVDYWPDDWQDE